MKETKQAKDNYFILTGAMGAGKSTLLKELRKLGLPCIDEPARQILAEQRSLQAEGVPENNPKLFTDLLLSRSIYQFKQMQNSQEPVIFDRGMPDNIAYAKLFNLNTQVSLNASQQYRYNKLVFFLPGWKEIYKNDDERKMTFNEANQFGHEIKKIYQALAYQAIDVPLDSPLSRAEFIFNRVVEK
ncbi:MAG: AAA family ATPase [Gammaproteobacteria bacterium]